MVNGKIVGSYTFREIGKMQTCRIESVKDVM